MEAVTSKMFKSKYLSIVETNLNAIFKPPPTISDTKLIMANIPLNVITNFLQFSLSSHVFLSVSLRLVVNLWKAAITLNNCSGLIFSNVSPQALPIAWNMPIRPLPIFLNELKGWDYSNASKTCQAGIQFLERKNKYETSKI